MALSLHDLLMNQSKDCDSARGSYEDSAVGNHGSDELVPRAELIAAAAGLIAVVQFFQIDSVIGVQDCGIRVLDRPDNRIASAIRRDTWIGTGIRVGIGCFGCGCEMTAAGRECLKWASN
jgi:hypothetical protein